MASNYYAEFVRTRITELRISRGVSEYRMSLDLDKCGSYIRSITSGRALPSLGELFNICVYFGITPSDFFAPWKMLIQLSLNYANGCRLGMTRNWKK